MDLQQHHSNGRQKMGVKIAEMAGGLLQFALAGLVVWVVLEVGCSIFFRWHERNEKGGE